ncbi:MAG: uroporphyrinogen-III C-methyltransferase [Bdellovibrio bacteriovorus]
MSADARSRLRSLQSRPARLWVPALLSTLILATVIGSIAVGHFYWNELRSSMGRMDQTLGDARERQHQMIEHFSQAQALLMAQQRRIQEAEEALRAREAKLAAEHADLEQARARLALVSASRESLQRQTQARDLARRLDANLAALTDPGGLAATSETLQALTQWASASTLVADSALGPTLSSALADSRDALAQLEASGPAQLARRIERLGVQATGLVPARARPDPRGPGRALSAAAGAGHLGEQLQTALFALHRGDEALFRLALDTATAWLTAFYDPTRPDVQAVQAELAALHRHPVTQDLSPLRAALVRLRAVLGELTQTTGDQGEPEADALPSKAGAPD